MYVIHLWLIVPITNFNTQGERLAKINKIIKLQNDKVMKPTKWWQNNKNQVMLINFALNKKLM